MNKVYGIEPFPYVRQTTKSYWNPKSKAYHANKDHLRALGFDYQEGWGFTFVLSMPKSWSNKKRTEMLGQPVKRPKWKDIDNLEKSCLDCLDYDDGTISIVGPKRKIWGTKGKIIVHQKDICTEYFST